MTVAGTISTLRVTGVPSGYPAEQESNVKVRFVDTVLEVMSDTDVPLLKRLGGIDQFTADNTKYEWVLGDTWADRGTISGAHNTVVTTLTLTAAYAHRFPRGSVLRIDDELVWVQAQLSTTELTIVRDYAGSTAATHASGATFRLVGFTEVEGTAFVMRGSALREMAYNFFNIIKGAVSESWAQTESNIYTRRGATIPEMMGQYLKEIMVGLEGAVIEGRRYEGTGVNDPPMSGGLRYFGTSANGATVIDCGGAVLSRALLNQGFDASWLAVGLSNMAKLIMGGIGVSRTLWREFKEPYLHTNDAGASATEGRFERLMNEYGAFEFMGPFKRIPDGEAWGINPALIQVGKYGTLGRLHEGSIPTNGDFNAQYVYGMYGNKIKGVPGIIRWHNFTTV